MLSCIGNSEYPLQCRPCTNAQGTAQWSKLISEFTLWQFSSHAVGNESVPICKSFPLCEKYFWEELLTRTCNATHMMRSFLGVHHHWLLIQCAKTPNAVLKRQPAFIRSTPLTLHALDHPPVWTWPFQRLSYVDELVLRRSAAVTSPIMVTWNSAKQPTLLTRAFCTTPSTDAMLQHFLDMLRPLWPTQSKVLYTRPTAPANSST